VIVAHVEKNSTAEKISVILVVEEYADVFPDEIPELPRVGMWISPLISSLELA